VYILHESVDSEPEIVEGDERCIQLIVAMISKTKNRIQSLQIRQADVAASPWRQRSARWAWVVSDIKMSDRFLLA
jgi:hypothetical protein